MKVQNKIPSQFPNIYRIITERTDIKKILLVLKQIFLSALIVGLLIFILVFLYISYTNFEKLSKISAEKLDLEAKVKVWEDITKKYPGHKEAYFQTGLIYYRLKNYESAKIYVDKAIFVDPDYEDAKKLKKLIGENY